MNKAIYLILSLLMIVFLACGGGNDGDGEDGNGGNDGDDEMYTLTMTTEPLNSGSVMKNPDQANYVRNANITLIPTPENGYQFKQWTGSNGAEVTDNQIIMNDNKNITAVFEEENLEEPESYFFTDDFETGDHSHSENGFIWSGNNVEVAETPNGTMGLKYSFGPDTLDEDSWREQRFHLGGDYPELWIKYDLYIPANYHHRCPVELQLEAPEPGMQTGDTILHVKNEDGSGYTVPDPERWGEIYDIDDDTIWVDKLSYYYTFLDGYEFRNQRTGVISQVQKRLGYGHNNKFFLVWQGGYGSSTTGNMVDFEFWSNDRGSSKLSYYPAKDNGAWKPGHTFANENIIDKETDRGKWMEIIIHIKISGPSNDNGILHLWKNGNEYLHVTDLPNYSELGFNYFQYGYLLGWSNSGYTEETLMYIDDVVFSTKEITSKY